jgi:hypothetical protein
MISALLSFVLGLIGLTGWADEKPTPMPAKEPELQSELLLRTKADQEARTALTEWIKAHGSNGALNVAELSQEQQAEFERISVRMSEVDEENTKWLKGVVEKHGWPTNTLVGKDGADAAWLLVQHADADPRFQRQCLDLMAGLPKDEVSQSKRAYLTDRVLLAEGKKQLYGTQFHSVEGRWKPRPIEDEAQVDKRRTEIGLPPLAEYARLIEQQYGSGSKN